MTSLLEKRYTCSFFTLNILSQQHLLEGFLVTARDYFRDLGLPVRAGGLDVVRMSPSLKKDEILRVHKQLYQKWKPMLDLQRGPKDVHLSIGRTSQKKLDSLGCKEENLCRVYTVPILGSRRLGCTWASVHCIQCSMRSAG